MQIYRGLERRGICQDRGSGKFYREGDNTYLYLVLANELELGENMDNAFQVEWPVEQRHGHGKQCDSYVEQPIA